MCSRDLKKNQRLRLYHCCSCKSSCGAVARRSRAPVLAEGTIFKILWRSTSQFLFLSATERTARTCNYCVDTDRSWRACCFHGRWTDALVASPAQCRGACAAPPGRAKSHTRTRACEGLLGSRVGRLRLRLTRTRIAAVAVCPPVSQPPPFNVASCGAASCCLALAPARLGGQAMIDFPFAKSFRSLDTRQALCGIHGLWF